MEGSPCGAGGDAPSAQGRPCWCPEPVELDPARGAVKDELAEAPFEFGFRP
jgi:hypothetical protein